MESILFWNFFWKVHFHSVYFSLEFIHRMSYGFKFVFFFTILTIYLWRKMLVTSFRPNFVSAKRLLKPFRILQKTRSASRSKSRLRIQGVSSLAVYRARIPKRTLWDHLSNKLTNTWGKFLSYLKTFHVTESSSISWQNLLRSSISYNVVRRFFGTKELVLVMGKERNKSSKRIHHIVIYLWYQLSRPPLSSYKINV